MNIRQILSLPPPLLGWHALYSWKLSIEQKTCVCVCVCVGVCSLVPTLGKKYLPQGCQLTREPSHLNDLERYNYMTCTSPGDQFLKANRNYVQWLVSYQNMDNILPSLPLSLSSGQG